jgi:glycosyltransferase involved in cell wall biosynthesis
MSRILVFCKYLPSLTRRRIALSATSYRSEQLVRPLMGAEHELTVFTSGLFGRSEKIFQKRTLGNVEYYETSYSHFDQRAEIERALGGRRFEAVLAVSQLSSKFALEFCGDRPFWCDLYGSVMGEAQAKCYRERSNGYLTHFLSMEVPVIERADKLSTCGRWQEHMLCGELALIGRLNQENFGYQLVHGMLPGVIDPKALGLEVPEPGALRGKRYPRDAHVVLWMGGYNTWTDVDTLFAGLEAAMARNRRLMFVSIGGAIPGHDEVTYQRFQKMIARSRHAKRYLLEGWVERSEIGKYLTGADLGLNIDSWHYETVFGTRTRLVEMLGYGLPVVTSRGCELSELLEDAGKALAFEIGDAKGLADVLVEYFRRPAKQRRAFARSSQQWAQSELSFSKTTAPLQRWAREPVSAGDRGQRYLRQLELNLPAFRIDAPHAASLPSKAWTSLRQHGVGVTMKRGYRYLRNRWSGERPG